MSQNSPVHVFCTNNTAGVSQ